MVFIKNFDPKKIAEHYDLYNLMQRPFDLEQKIKVDVKEGRADRLLYLFEEGYDLFNPKLELMHIAARNGQLECMKLFTYMAESKEITDEVINVKDKYGYTPLISALRHEHWKVAEHIIFKNADVNILSAEDDLSVLHYAVRADDIDLVALLINEGADVIAKAADGTTPLHLAAMNDNKEMAIKLMIAGAKPELNKANQLPLDLVDRKKQHQWLDVFPRRRKTSLEPYNFSLEAPRLIQKLSLFESKRPFSVSSHFSAIPSQSVKPAQPPRPISSMWKSPASLPKATNVASLVTSLLRRMPK